LNKILLEQKNPGNHMVVGIFACSGALPNHLKKRGTQSKTRTGGSRPAIHLTFSNAKKVSKKAGS
jgi:hypothetical protein